MRQQGSSRGQDIYIDTDLQYRLVFPRNISLFIRFPQRKMSTQHFRHFPFFDRQVRCFLYSWNANLITQYIHETWKNCSPFVRWYWLCTWYQPLSGHIPSNTRYSKIDPSWEYSVEINYGSKTALARNLYAWLVRRYYTESKIYEIYLILHIWKNDPQMILISRMNIFLNV